MDLFYFFFHFALNSCKIKGNICFITTNYYLTADGAKLLRKDFHNRSILLNLINFNELKIFESALGQHNIVTILQRDQNPDFFVKACITNRTGNATPEVIQKIINWDDSQTVYDMVSQKDIYDGIENYIRPIKFQENGQNNISEILDKIKGFGSPLINLCNVNQGIISGVDKITYKHIKNKLIDSSCKNNGVYVLSDAEFKKLNLSDSETKIIKPFFKNSDIGKYFCSIMPERNLIYATRDLNIDDFLFLEK